MKLKKYFTVAIMLATIVSTSSLMAMQGEENPAGEEASAVRRTFTYTPPSYLPVVTPEHGAFTHLIERLTSEPETRMLHKLATQGHRPFSTFYALEPSTLPEHVRVVSEVESTDTDTSGPRLSVAETFQVESQGGFLVNLIYGDRINTGYSVRLVFPKSHYATVRFDEGNIYYTLK